MGRFRIRPVSLLVLAGLLLIACSGNSDGPAVEFEVVAKAARVSALQELLRATTFDTTLLVRDLALAGDGLTCDAATDPAEIRTRVEVGMDHGETATEWAVAEATYVAGVCPDLLDSLYENVAQAGFPDAADEAETMIEDAAEQAGVPL